MKIYKLTGLLLLFLFINSMGTQAQSWRDLFKNQGSGTTNQSIDNKDFIGSWSYVGSAIDFKTNDLLKKAGGAVAAAQIKTQVDEQLAKFGVKTGLVDFVFGNDSTFTCVMNGKFLKGTYLYNPADKKAAITFAGFLSLDASVKTINKNKMSLLFDADKLLVLLSYLGERANNPTFKAIGTLAGTYDGMLLGLEIKKK